jgi:hypothetical protein
MLKATIAATADFLTLAPFDAVADKKLERFTHAYARKAAAKVAERSHGEFIEYEGDKAQKLVAVFNAHPPASNIVAQYILIVASDNLTTVLVGFVNRGQLSQWAVLPTESWTQWRHEAFEVAAAPAPSNDRYIASNGVAK